MPLRSGWRKVGRELDLDAARYGLASGVFRFPLGFLIHQGFRAGTLYRIGHMNRYLGIACLRLMHHLCHCSISPKAVIGQGILLPHPAGITIGAGVQVGEFCTIQQNVCLGGNYGKSINGREKPKIGNGVRISVGAVVVRPVTVSDGALIPANAVVNRDFA